MVRQRLAGQLCQALGGREPCLRVVTPQVRRGTVTQTSNPTNYASFCDNAGNCWFARLTPNFQTGRTGLGIHPDGGVEGTSGCVGATGDNTQSLRDAIHDGMTLTVTSGTGAPAQTQASTPVPPQATGPTVPAQ
jgi:hypothetical protein